MSLNKNNVFSYLLGCLFFLLMACDIQDNEIKPGLSFTRIYNTHSFDETFYPLDVVQTSDSGYFILAANESWTPYFLKTDQTGAFEWDQKLPEPYVNVMDAFYQVEGQLFIVCMDELSLNTNILRISTEGGEPELVFSSNDITYPLSASLTPDGGWLIQSFERESRKTRISKLTSAFSFEWQQDFDILEDKEEEVIKHLTRSGKRLPFFTGHSQGGGNSGFYYFNGFNNFTISLTFINTNDGSALGVVNGFRDLGYIKAALPLSNGSFALAKHSYGDNYLLPQAQVATNNILSSNDLESSSFPEIDARAPVKIINTQIINKSVSLYATHTKSNQVILYAYDSEDGSLQDVMYLGENAPYEIGNIKRTSDGGLIVLGKTFVADRFPRLCLFKLTREEIESMVR